MTRYDHDLFFFSSRRRHTKFKCDWSSDVCSSDLVCRIYNGCKRIALPWKRQTHHFGLPSAFPTLLAANAEEEMRKKRISVLALLLALTFSVSCSRLGAPSDDAITTDIKAKMFSEPPLKNAPVDVSTKPRAITLA